MSAIKKYFSLLLISIFLFSACGEEKTKKIDFALAIHGGAGVIKRGDLTSDQEVAYMSKLEEALHTGFDILKQGGSSVDAVESVIRLLEDSPIFNAGKGAVFTNKGTHELDASIMNGEDLSAGAVTGIQHVKNPITLARLIMEKSPHVMLMSDGAEDFAKEFNLEFVKNDYFDTERRRAQWLNTTNDVSQSTDATGSTGAVKEIPGVVYGTVGCVALDKNGNLAAGTSTGGMTNKSFGRIGDTPIIGAGTYANNKTCAVSSTGHGEYFIRGTIAYDISALMEYKSLNLEEAADLVINQKLTGMGGTGGVICLDKTGNITMPFNTTGMYRGYLKSNGEKEISIYLK